MVALACPWRFTYRSGVFTSWLWLTPLNPAATGRWPFSPFHSASPEGFWPKPPVGAGAFGQAQPAAELGPPPKHPGSRQDSYRELLKNAGRLRQAPAFERSSSFWGQKGPFPLRVRSLNGLNGLSLSLSHQVFRKAPKVPRTRGPQL